MTSITVKSFIRDPRFQVTATWIWNLVGVFLVVAIAALIMQGNPSIDQQALLERPALALIPILSEIVLVGLLPILFSILNKDRPADLGITGKNLTQSLVLAAVVVLVYFTYQSLLVNQPTTGIQWPGLHQVKPGNACLALAGLLAYGPLEVFFVVWLIHKTDRIFHSETRIWSWGLLITIGIYLLLHTFSQGLYALVIASEMLVLGLIFKRTRTAIGPMLAFLFVNGYAWFLAGALLP